MTTDLHHTLRFEISITREKFHRFLITIPDAVLNLPSKNPGWKNGELLYLMSLSPLIIKSILIKNMYASAFSCSLSNRLTNPRIQGRNEVYIRSRARNATCFAIAMEYNETCSRVLEMLAKIPDDGFAKYLTVYERDELLPPIVSAEQLFHYVKKHFDTYRHQIDLGSNIPRKDSA